jgi:zinc protease
LEFIDRHTHNTMTVDRYRLSNGLEVLHQESHRAALVSYQTWFRVGSGDELVGKTGIAHLFEHLMFKGTHTVPEGEFDRRLEGVGGRLNAATWLDWTYFYEDVPSDALAEVVSLEADRMANLRLEPAPFASEREVVLNERRECVDNDPHGLLSELLWHSVFPTHPYGQPTIGWMGDIEGITLDDCLGFYDTYYAPNNAVVVVAGDVDRDGLEALIGPAYGHLPARPIPSRRRVAVAPQTESRRVERALPLGADRLLLGYAGASVLDDDAVALDVLSEVLGGGDSARLQRALVTEGEVASGAYTSVSSIAQSGVFEIAVDLRGGHPAEEAEAIILDTVSDVAAGDVTEAEVRRATNKLETRFFRGLATTQQRALSIGYWEATAGDFRRLFDFAERCREVTLAQVTEVARRVLDPQRRNVVIGRSRGVES